MLADITGFVYCEHREYVREDAPGRWDYPKSREITCTKRAEAILRYTSYRGHDRLYVRAFVSFVSTGWYAYVDSEGSCHVYCPDHKPKYVSGASYQVES